MYDLKAIQRTNRLARRALIREASAGRRSLPSSSRSSRSTPKTPLVQVDSAVKQYITAMTASSQWFHLAEWIAILHVLTCGAPDFKSPSIRLSLARSQPSNVLSSPLARASWSIQSPSPGCSVSPASHQMPMSSTPPRHRYPKPKPLVWDAPAPRVPPICPKVCYPPSLQSEVPRAMADIDTTSTCILHSRATALTYTETRQILPRATPVWSCTSQIGTKTNNTPQPSTTVSPQWSRTRLYSMATAV